MIPEQNLTSVENFLPLDQKVWDAWIAKNRLEERVFFAKWSKRLGLVAVALVTMTALYFLGR
jgi:hypothetical protein